MEGKEAKCEVFQNLWKYLFLGYFWDTPLQARLIGYTTKEP